MSCQRDAHPLRQVEDGGLGFCHDADRSLFVDREAHDGPLIVALDTNIVIDIHRHGRDLINDGAPAGSSQEAKEHGELVALGQLVELWFTRDIRFLPLARSLTDSRRPMSSAQLASRAAALDSIAASLAFQSGAWRWDWREATRLGFAANTTATVADIPGDADRELVNAAMQLGVDVFLTRDDRVLKADKRLHGINLWSPSTLLERLNNLAVTAFDGGIVRHVDCVYALGVPFGDTGKWAGLLEALNSPGE